MKDPNLFVDDHVKLAHMGANRSTSQQQQPDTTSLESTSSSADQHLVNNPYSTQEATSHHQHIVANSEFEYTNKIALNYIWPTVPIGFLILGTVANLLSIIVFRRREMKKFSSFCYFFYLNCVNLAVLYITMVRVISEFNFKVDIRRLSLFTCKLHVFLTYFLSHLSSMLLCTISIDRVISVMFIHRAKLLCTPRVAGWVSLGLVVFNFALSSHFLIFESGYVTVKHFQQDSSSEAAAAVAATSFSPAASIINNIVVEQMPQASKQLTDSATAAVTIERLVICDPVPETFYSYIVQDVWKIIDMSIYAFIPFTIMLICSVIIIGRVAQQSKKFNKNANKQSPTGGGNNQQNTNGNSNQGGGGPLLKTNRASRCQRNMSEDLISTTNIPTTATTASSAGARVSSGAVAVSSNKPGSNEARMSTRTRNLALMLIPVNFLFLAFLAPVVIAMYTYDRLWEDKLTLAIIELLSYCNFTVNFFIYFLTSSKFREEFFKFLDEVYKRRRKSSPPNTTITTNNGNNGNNNRFVKNGVANKPVQRL